MFTHTNTNSNSFTQPPLESFPQSEIEFSSLTMNGEIEASSLISNGVYYSSGSGSSSHVGSPSSTFLQRTTSSDTPYKGGCVRRVYSAGDLEGVNSYIVQRKERGESPLSISEENSMIIEGMLKVSKYSPEEKKERIERYRSKRNQRNFNKKIQYECRKTLADSRIRVKGRFARSDEISTMATTMMRMEDDHGYDDRVLNDQYSSTHQDQRMAVEHEDDEGEMNSWIDLLNYSFPSQYEH